MPSASALRPALALVAAAASLAAAPAVSLAETRVLTPTADALVLDGSESPNPYTGILASELGTSGNGSVWLSTLKFDLTSLAGLSVERAWLQLTAFTHHGSGSYWHQVFSSSDDSWTEDSITGATRPADASLTLLAAATIDDQTTAVSWNVLAGVMGADGLAGDGVLTLVVRPDLAQAGGSFGPHFHDRTAQAGFPQLIVDVTPVPEPTAAVMLATGLALLAWRSRAAGARTASGWPPRARRTALTSP